MRNSYRLTVVEKPAAEGGGHGKTSEYDELFLEWIEGYLYGRFPHYAMLGIGSYHSIDSVDDMEGYFDDINGGAILVFKTPWAEWPPDPNDAVAIITDLSTP